VEVHPPVFAYVGEIMELRGEQETLGWPLLPGLVYARVGHS